MWASPPLVPELLLGSFPDLAMREFGAHPAYFDHAWMGGNILARWLLDHPDVVAGRRVLEVGCGGGLVALAARAAGASRVTAIDCDDRAVEAAARNAKHNGLEVEVLLADFLREGFDTEPFDLVLGGELIYPASGPAEMLEWLEARARAGLEVLIGDSGRGPWPPPGSLQVIWEQPPCTVYRVSGVI